MIKGITTVRKTGTPAAFDKLASFFSAIGFERGKGWDEEQSRGRAFQASLGKLEFIDGVLPSKADVFVEVTSLDSVREVAEKWLTKNLGEARAQKRIPATADTDWASGMFTVEPVPGVAFSFWEWLDPLKGKPVA